MRPTVLRETPTGKQKCAEYEGRTQAAMGARRVVEGERREGRAARRIEAGDSGSSAGAHLAREENAEERSENAERGGGIRRISRAWNVARAPRLRGRVAKGRVNRANALGAVAGLKTRVDRDERRAALGRLERSHRIGLGDVQHLRGARDAVDRALCREEVHPVEGPVGVVGRSSGIEGALRVASV